MTKEQFLDKWRFGSNPPFESDLEAVIATEIEKAKVQPALNPIEQAFERGEKIRKKNWGNQSWYKKYDEKYVITNCGNVYAIFLIDFNSIKKEPEKWELYTEPTEQTAQPSSQAKLDNSFDRNRFEAMFRAVVASGEYMNIVEEIEQAEIYLQKLDAYYATKNN